jgi:hypothetical protein
MQSGNHAKGQINIQYVKGIHEYQYTIYVYLIKKGLNLSLLCFYVLSVVTFQEGMNRLSVTTDPWRQANLGI